MPEEKVKSRKIFIIVISFLIVAAVALLYIFVGRPYQEKTAKKAFVEETRRYFKEEIPDAIRPYLEEFPLEGDLIIETESVWEERKGNYKYQGIDWIDTLTVILKTDDSYNDLTDREKYNYLQKLGWLTIDNNQKLMEKMCPDYFQAYKLTAGVYGETVFPDQVYDVFIKTSYNTYKYLQGLNDCYGTGPKGETIHYLRDPQSKYYKDPEKAASKTTPTPSAKSAYKPSSGSSPQDPYNVQEYSSAEDFYYWQRDDFYDYEDAEEYWLEHAG